MQIERGALLRLALADGRVYRTLFAAQSVAIPVAGFDYIIKNEAHDFVSEMPGDVLRAMVPKADAPLRVNDINSHGQVFNQMPEELRVVEKGRDHEQTRRLMVLSAGTAGTSEGRLGAPCGLGGEGRHIAYRWAKRVTMRDRGRNGFKTVGLPPERARALRCLPGRDKYISEKRRHAGDD